MNKSITGRPWQSYDIFDAAEQWGFKAEAGKDKILGEGVYVRKNIIPHYFITSEGYAHTIYKIDSFKKPIEIAKTIWSYDVGVKIAHLLNN